MLSDTLLSTRPPVDADRLDTAVRELMRPGVVVVAGHASVAQAQRALLAHGVHAILVLDDATGRPLGWATSRGLLRWADRDVALASARDAVTEPALAIEPSAPAREALDLLQRESATRLLVVRVGDGLPEGVVADLDLLRLLSR
jgi:CBS domain-containing protein